MCACVYERESGYRSTFFKEIILSFPNDRFGTTATGCGAQESHKAHSKSLCQKTCRHMQQHSNSPHCSLFTLVVKMNLMSSGKHECAQSQPA